MINTLSNKLFQFETTKEEKCKENFLFWLASDIIELFVKVKEKGLEYSLTPHEREVVEKAKEYVDAYNKMFLVAC